MRKTVREMVKCEQDELHQNVTIPQDLAHRERDRLMEHKLAETQTNRLKRLAFEQEYLNNNQAEAESYLQQLMQLQEGEPQVMINLSRFYLRQGNLDRAEHYMRDAYSYDIKNN